MCGDEWFGAVNDWVRMDIGGRGVRGVCIASSTEWTPCLDETPSSLISFRGFNGRHKFTIHGLSLGLNLKGNSFLESTSYNVGQHRQRRTAQLARLARGCAPGHAPPARRGRAGRLSAGAWLTFIPTPLTSFLPQINRAFNNFITTNTALLLHATLHKYALQIPPSVLASTSAATLLSTLRERVTRFRTISPASSYLVDLEADEGRLYEYLEGVLLRGSGIPQRAPGRRGATPLPSAVTVYDLTVEKEWETIEVSNEAGPLQEEEEEEVVEESAPSSSRTVKRRKTTSSFPPRTSTSHPPTYDDDESEEEIILAEGDDPESYIKRKWFPNPQEFAPPPASASGRERGNVIKDIAMDPGNDLFVVARAE